MPVERLGERRDFRTIFDNLGEVAIWTATEPGRFDYVSQGIEDIWGIPADRIESEPAAFVEGVHPDDRDRVLAVIRRDPEDREPESFEHRVVRPDGTVRWVHARVFPIRNEDGTLQEAVGITTDITEQRRRQEELEALNRIVRHDIRNDMNVIIGWTELLEDHVDAAGEDHLRRILDGSRHVVELTEIARDYIETLTGEDDLPVEPTPLRRTLDKELEMAREAYPEATFERGGSPPAVAVRANEMLGSVFRNLLNNAVQHHRSDSPTVTVTSEEHDGAVLVRVADDGPGIPDSRKEDVFGKGEKGIESPGTGIGLYLVETLVDGFGGDVWIEDNEPTGAVVCVELPTVD